MKTLIKFSDAPCHPVLARRSTWPRGFRNTSREQLAEIGRAFARGDKRTVDQAYAELKATSLQHGRRHPQLGMLTMSNSTLSGNSAYSGGAIHNWSGATLTIANSTLAATFAAPRSTPTAAASSDITTQGLKNKKENTYETNQTNARHIADSYETKILQVRTALLFTSGPAQHSQQQLHRVRSDFQSRRVTSMTALANAVFLCGAVLSMSGAAIAQTPQKSATQSSAQFQVGVHLSRAKPDSGEPDMGAIARETADAIAGNIEHP